MRQIFALLLVVVAFDLVAADAAVEGRAVDAQASKVLWSAYATSDDSCARLDRAFFASIRVGLPDAEFVVVERAVVSNRSNGEAAEIDEQAASGWHVQEFPSVGAALLDYHALILARKSAWLVTGNRHEAIVVWKR